MANNEIYQCSRLVAAEEIRGSNCFTALPVRVNVRNELAEQGTLRAHRDWERYFGDGRGKSSYSSQSLGGDFASLMFPECLPDRLEGLAFFSAVAFLHDDVGEETTSLDDAVADHKEFGAAYDIFQKHQSTPGSSLLSKKQLVAQEVLDCLNIDSKLGRRLMEHWNTKWLDVMDTTEPKPINSLEEYYRVRWNNVGARLVTPMIMYGLGIDISEAEEKSTMTLCKTASLSMLHVNDYSSFDKEYELCQRMQTPERMMNAVAILMKIDMATASVAKESVKALAIEYEMEFIRQKELYYHQNPILSLDMRRWIEALESIVGGNNYWHSTALRYNKSLQTEIEAIPPSAFDSPYGISGSLKQKKTLNIPRVNGDVNADTTATAFRMQHTKSLTESVILAPYVYINSTPSKGVRTTLVDSINIWLEVETKELDCVKEIGKMLHNSSLILDDIEDGSCLRRSRPATHAVFGTAQSINSATYVYVQAVRKVLQNSCSAEALPILLAGLEQLFIGQSWDLHWGYNLICPSEEAYLSMIDHKTGALFYMLMKLMQIYSPFDFRASAHQQEEVTFENFASLLGRFFQIRDDYLNITSSFYTGQKGVCEDFDEGKMSYLIVHCLGAQPGFKDIILGLFRQRSLKAGEPMGIQTKMYLLDCLEKAGSLETTKMLLNKLETDLENEIGRLEDLMGQRNPLLRLLVKSLALSNEK